MNPKIKRVAVFGLGAAGANVLQHVAYAHPDLHLIGIDFDTVEQRNFEAGTQPYTKADLNRAKTQAMGRILSAARAKHYVSFSVKVVSTKMIGGILLHPIDGVVPKIDETLVIDAFDNAESRNLFLPLKADGCHVLHVGFSPMMTGEAVWAESYSEMTPNAKGNFDICQQQVARPFIHALTAIATLIITEFITTGKKRSVYFDAKLKTFTF